MSPIRIQLVGAHSVLVFQCEVAIRLHPGDESSHWHFRLGVFETVHIVRLTVADYVLTWFVFFVV